MADFNKVYGAGLRNGTIRTSAGTSYDINAIVTVDSDTEQEDTEIKGDDVVKAVLGSSRKETLTITANGLTFDQIAAITGNTASSSASGIQVPLGTVVEMNAPYVEVTAQTNGRADDGTAIVIEKTWHKVQLNKVVLHMAGETEFSIDMSGFGYQTDETITGSALSPSRIATLHVYAGTAD